MFTNTEMDFIEAAFEAYSSEGFQLIEDEPNLSYLGNGDHAREFSRMLLAKIKRLKAKWLESLPKVEEDIPG